MKKIRIIGRVFVLLAFFSLANVLTPIASVPQEPPPEDFVKEAKKLHDIEEDYFQKRLKSEWQAIYDYQHPDYRKKISMEEFKYFNGRTLYDYAETTNAMLSGNATQLRNMIKNNPEPKDMFGVPLRPKYQLFNSPLYFHKNHTIPKISISKDGKYAKAHYKVDVFSQFPPEFRWGTKGMDIVVTGADFWEKVGDTWFITILKEHASICGGITALPYHVPSNNDAWEKMEFVEVDVNLLRPKTATTEGQSGSQN